MSIIDQHVTSRITDTANRVVRVVLSHVARKAHTPGGWVTGKSAQESVTQTSAELRPPDPEPGPIRARWSPSFLLK